MDALTSVLLVTTLVCMAILLLLCIKKNKPTGKPNVELRKDRKLERKLSSLSNKSSMAAQDIKLISVVTPDIPRCMPLSTLEKMVSEQGHTMSRNSLGGWTIQQSTRSVIFGSLGPLNQIKEESGKDTELYEDVTADQPLDILDTEIPCYDQYFADESSSASSDVFTRPYSTSSLGIESEIIQHMDQAWKVDQVQDQADKMADNLDRMFPFDEFSSYDGKFNEFYDDVESQQQEKRVSKTLVLPAINDDTYKSFDNLDQLKPNTTPVLSTTTPVLLTTTPALRKKSSEKQEINGVSAETNTEKVCINKYRQKKGVKASIKPQHAVANNVMWREIINDLNNKVDCEVAKKTKMEQQTPMSVLTGNRKAYLRSSQFMKIKQNGNFDKSSVCIQNNPSNDLDTGIEHVQNEETGFNQPLNPGHTNVNEISASNVSNKKDWLCEENTKPISVLKSMFEEKAKSNEWRNKAASRSVIIKPTQRRVARARKFSMVEDGTDKQ